MTPRGFGGEPPAWPDSPNWRDGAFRNRIPARMAGPGLVPGFAVEWATKRLLQAAPTQVPVVRPKLPETAADLGLTWLGHATVLLEIDGHWVLIDPVWSRRVSPVGWAGPSRTHPMPIDLADLPPLSAIVISHDHYDHLDFPTVAQLRRLSDAPFVVPLGVGAHLRAWGLDDDRIVERDWGGQFTTGSLTFTCTEARHFSGRGLTRDRTLWSSWVIAGGGPQVFFGGDTGYTPAFAELGATYGPMDFSIVPIGAYDSRWADIHLTPEEAVQTHLDVGGSLLVPIHWLTFDLAFHPWAEPPERLLADATRRDVAVAWPKPGERVDPTDPPGSRWWQSGVLSLPAT